MEQEDKPNCENAKRMNMKRRKSSDGDTENDENKEVRWTEKV